MVFCKNRIFGCPRTFTSRYGMKIHLRSCANENRTSRCAHSIVYENGVPQSTLNSIEERPHTEDERMHSDDRERGSSELLHPEMYHGLVEPEHVAEDIVASAEMQNKSVQYIASTGTSLNSLLKIRLGRIGRKCSQKDVNDIIRVMAHPSFQLSSFLSNCSSYRECMIEEEGIVQKSLGTIGFVKHEITDPKTGISCDVYLRSAVEVLRIQLSGACSKSCHFEAETNAMHFDHPMTAQLGRDCVPAVINTIMSSRANNILWHDGNSSLESSFVGLIQIYSDKTKTSLKESGFQFYPLHIVLLNFSEDYRRECIVNGNTFLAFLPVQFYKNVDGVRVQANTDRLQRLRLLHLAMNLSLREIRESGYSGFSCSDNEGGRRRCHPCLVSYCCDLPESKDMSAVRNGNRSDRNCNRCLAGTDSFNVFTRASSRIGVETANIIQKARNLRKEGKKEESEKLMDRYSLVDQIPSLIDMPFFGLHSLLDMHLLFGFEPLHSFHLGASKELKKCIAERLRSETLVTTAIPNKTGINRERTFKTVRMTILNGINKMLSHIQSYSPAKSLRVDFSASSKEESGNGLYGEDGRLIGMLEAKDYRSVDMVSPFIAMFTDRCCGEVSSAPCTKVFVEYVDIMEMSMSYTGSKNWSDEKIERLETMIEQFKKNATELFGHHQKSQFRTEKFHSLDHICQDIRRMGGLVYGDAGLYEYAHTLIKTAYRSGSKRRRSAMDESIQSFLKEMNHRSLYKVFEAEEHNQAIPSKSQLKPNLKSAQNEAMRTDCAVLVGKGISFSLEDLQKCRSLMRMLRKAEERESNNEIRVLKSTLNQMDIGLSDIVEDVSEDGCRVFIKQVFDLHSKYKRSSEKAQFTRITSCYVPGIETPCARDCNHRIGMIDMKRSSIRCMQRIVSGRGFYGSENLRQDCVLLQGNHSSSSRASLWVAKVLMMVRFAIPSETGATEQEQDSGLEEYVFVQYFEIQKPEDGIDDALGCVRLRWARDGAEIRSERSEGNFDPVQKWFDLLPVSSIRGMVHVVRGDYGLQGRCVTTDIDEVHWYEQSFYINRFYFNSTSTRYNVDE